MKKSPLAKRIKRLEKELSAVDNDLKALAKGKSIRSPAPRPAAPPKKAARRPPRPSPSGGAAERDAGEDAAVGAGPEPASPVVPEKVEQEVKEIGRRIHDRRFADYLSTSFQSMRPLRHERRIQRNKAILMAVLALLALFWMLYRRFQ